MISTTGRQFFDTNVLVYAFDSGVPAKQQVARDLIAAAASGATAVLSVQVSGEFFHTTVVRTKLLSVTEAEKAINAFRKTFEVASVSDALVDAAIQIHKRYQLRYWDALILATANDCGCQELLSEDMNAGQDYDGVTVVNPF